MQLPLLSEGVKVSCPCRSIGGVTTRVIAGGVFAATCAARFGLGGASVGRHDIFLGGWRRFSPGALDGSIGSRGRDYRQFGSKGALLSPPQVDGYKLSCPASFNAILQIKHARFSCFYFFFKFVMYSLHKERHSRPVLEVLSWAVGSTY